MMEQYVDRAIKKLKQSGQWAAYEERINYDYDYVPKQSPSRALLLIILRGESPETIPIRLQLKSSRRSNATAYVEDIKEQLISYFASETHRTREFPKAFSIKEVLNHYPEISDWFFQSEDNNRC